MSDFKQLSRSVKGLTVLVTGAASGMGRATARVFAVEGANVAVTDYDEQGARAVAKEIAAAGGAAKAWKLDVADGGEIKRVVGDVAAHFGGLDIIVNNAGISVRVAIDDEAYEDAWARGIAVMLTAHPRIIRAALPHLRKSKSPRIVNIASTEALGATALHSPYSAAKGGVASLTRSLARGGARPRRHHRQLHLPGADPHWNHRPDIGRAQDDLRQAPHRIRPLRRSRRGRAHDAEPVPAGSVLPHRRCHSGRRRPDGAQRLRAMTLKRYAPPALTSPVTGVTFSSTERTNRSQLAGDNAMTIAIRQLQTHFVGEVSGLDLREPLTEAEAREIEAAMDKYAVLVFHDQDITDEQQMAFALNFGQREDARGGTVTKEKDYRLQSGLNDVSNLGKDGKPLAKDSRAHLFNLGNCLWHSDSSFRPIPAKFSLLSARVLNPKGGNTEFADMRAAYDALDNETKAEIDDLVCEHSLMYSRGSLGFTEYTDDEKQMFKPVLQRLVRTHPVHRRKSLYLSSHAGKIVGMSVPEGRLLLRDLNEHATQGEFVYVHKWKLHDLVMWDNRQTMHRVRRYDQSQPRDMRRATVAGTEPTVQQQAAE